MTLVKLLFMNPSLDWNRPGDHVELFAGTMSVTRGEWQEPSVFQQKISMFPTSPMENPLLPYRCTQRYIIHMHYIIGYNT